MKAQTMSETELQSWGRQLGAVLRGGECFELIGDVGAGKTALTKAIAAGMGVDEDVQSPTFTLSRIYVAGELELHHYDFYRLQEAGVMSYELSESLADPRAVTVIEWAETVAGVLPDERIVVRIAYTPDGMARIISTDAPERYNYLPL